MRHSEIERTHFHNKWLTLNILVKIKIIGFCNFNVCIPCFEAKKGVGRPKESLPWMKNGTFRLSSSNLSLTTHSKPHFWSCLWQVYWKILKWHQQRHIKNYISTMQEVNLKRFTLHSSYERKLRSVAVPRRPRLI